MKGLEEILNAKKIQILLVLKRHGHELNQSEIQRKIESTYSHTRGKIKELEEEGLVQRRKDGREKLVSLTEIGEKKAKYLQILRRWDKDA